MTHLPHLASSSEFDAPQAHGVTPPEPKKQAETRGTKEELHQRTTQRPHVLLVEDNDINQRILRRKLDNKGFQVSTANNGLEAVDFMMKLGSASESKHSQCESSNGTQAKVDCILMDQEMPLMDGNAASKGIRRLEEEGRKPRVPILGVSANVRSEQIDDMLASGMDGVITKPYKIEEMVCRIRGLLEKSEEG